MDKSIKNIISLMERIDPTYKGVLTERFLTVGELNQIASDCDKNPSEAQIEAGNYKKGHVCINGFNITIENPKGSTRSGTDEKGNKWSVTMNNHYGYFKTTEGKDGDHIDVFIGNNLNSKKIFVVDQVNKTGEFDEHKVMMGFDDKDSAKSSYLKNYSPGWKGCGKITEVDIDNFKKWLYNGTKRIKAFSEYTENK